MQTKLNLHLFPTLAAVFLASIFSATAAVPASAPVRERLVFNADWRFVKGDPADTGTALRYATIKPWLLPTGNAFTTNSEPPVRPEGNLGEDVAYTKADFNDSSWRKLNLPHDWGIEGPFIVGGDGATGRLPWSGIAWYRKHFTIPASDAGRRISLEIDGAMSYAAVWCNGKFVGGWPFGYASWSVDLTPHLKVGGENVISIRLDNPPTSSRWYPGGGIYRNVWLTKTSPVHIPQWGTYITTAQISKEMWTIQVQAKVENRSASEADVTASTGIFELRLDGQKGREVTPPFQKRNTPIPIVPGKIRALDESFLFNNPRLWSTKTPNRYLAITTIKRDGEVVDTYETPFGFRTIKFTPTNGFLLNGERLQINGVCNHHDLGALGTAINVRALERQIELLKEMGCNAIRTSHNPPAPELLDLCDRMGIVVMDESFDCWVAGKRANDYSRLFPDWHEQDTRAMIRRDRNHPSVILWSIGNEIGEQTQGDRGAAVAEELARFVHEEDPTRPTSAACNNARPGSRFAAAIDVIGLNYQGSRPSQQRPYGNYEAFHESSPDRFVFGSETASTISSRNEYVFPVAAQPGAISQVPQRGRRGGAATNAPTGPPPGQDVTNHQMSSYDLYYPSWATSPDTEFGAHDRFSFVGGEFVWTGFDYLGEPTPWDGNFPSRSSYFGILDLAGFKKDRFFIYQARWRSELPMVHILPHWNWPERVGLVTPVHIYTSGDEAELFLNGKSLGRKKKEQYQYRIRWDDVTYQPGELRVVAYRNGRRWATETVKTTGAAAKLVLSADRNRIAADGADLSFITVTVVDKGGLMVPRAKNQLKFEIEGPGEIVATDNGDATSFESFQAPQRKAFNGLALVIVRAKPGQSGAFTLKAVSEGLTSDDVTIRAR